MPSRSVRDVATPLVAVLAVVAAVCTSLGLMVPALAGTSQAATTPPWLQRLNTIRVAAGVPAATENSAWTTGIQHHLTYLELTPSSYRTGQYASGHTENPASPYYTSDGALEASRSNLVHGSSQTATSAVDAWFAAPFHAIGMLRPGLQQVAFAQDSSWAGMDIIGGYSSSIRSSTPVLFPGAGSTIDLTAYAGNESPDPLETCQKAHPGADYSKAGLPIIAMLPSAPATNLTASLTNPAGTTVTDKDADLCVVDENTYTSSDTVYGPTGLQILTNDHAVVLVPRTRLVAGTYAVRLTQSKQADVAWSFSVAPAGPSTATTTAPTTQPTTQPTTSTTTKTTTATTSSPATTSPATTATTSTTTATSATTSPPPVAQAPQVSTADVQCSYGARSSGSATVHVANPADGAGAATYDLTVGTDQSSTGAVPDGSSTAQTVTRLPAGTLPGSVSGSDSTSAVFSVGVPTCPAYQGVRVAIARGTAHHVRIRLDNTRNAVATRFRVEVGARTMHPRVGATERSVVRQTAHRTVRVRVYVGQHLVARARV